MLTFKPLFQNFLQDYYFSTAIARPLNLPKINENVPEVLTFSSDKDYLENNWPVFSRTNGNFPYSSDTIKAFTDGSCRNQHNEAIRRAGMGIYWENSDHFPSIAARLGDPPKESTSQRAELAAFIVALESSPYDIPLSLFVDSTYTMKSFTEWVTGWALNDWVSKSSKQPIKNQDLVQWAFALIQNFRSAPIQFNFTKAHNGISGNELADYLANLGSTLGYGEYQLIDKAILGSTAKDARLAKKFL